MNVMERIHINHRQMDFAKAANCKFTASQFLELMVLFPWTRLTRIPTTSAARPGFGTRKRSVRSWPEASTRRI